MNKPGNKNGAASRLLRALARPRSSQIIRVLLETPRSATEIAESLRLPKSTVGEDLRRLKSEGLVDEVEQREKRGAIVRLFLASRAARMVGAVEWQELRADQKRVLIINVFHTLSEWLSSALSWNSGDFSADAHWVVDIHTVDERGWSELVSLYQGALKTTERITRDSTARLAEGAKPRRRGCSGLLLFEMPDEVPPSSGGG